MQARTHLRDACMSLIDGWKKQEASGVQDGKSKQEEQNGDANGHTAASTAGAKGDGAVSGAGAANAIGEAAAAVGTAAGGVGGLSAGSFLGLMLAARDKSTGEGLTDLQVAAQVRGGHTAVTPLRCLLAGLCSSRLSA